MVASSPETISEKKIYKVSNSSLGVAKGVTNSVNSNQMWIEQL